MCQTSGQADISWNIDEIWFTKRNIASLTVMFILLVVIFFQSVWSVWMMLVYSPYLYLFIL